MKNRQKEMPALVGLLATNLFSGFTPAKIKKMLPQYKDGNRKYISAKQATKANDKLYLWLGKINTEPFWNNNK